MLYSRGIFTQPTKPRSSNYVARDTTSDGAISAAKKPGKEGVPTVLENLLDVGPDGLSQTLELSLGEPAARARGRAALAAAVLVRVVRHLDVG